MVSVEPGDPHNDQMLAQARDELRKFLDITVHPMIDQAEAQKADNAAMFAALALSWFKRPDYMPRDRLCAILSLTMITLAKEEREKR